MRWISAYLILWLFTIIYRKHLGVVGDIYILGNYFLFVCVIIWRTAQWYGVWKQYYSITLIVGIRKSRGIKQKSRVWPWETSDKCGGVVIQYWHEGNISMYIVTISVEGLSRENESVSGDMFQWKELTSIDLPHFPT